MVTQAAKELFALVNVACGGLIFLVFLFYLLLAKPRRAAVAWAMLLVVFLCALNAIVIYFLR